MSETLLTSEASELQDRIPNPVSAEAAMGKVTVLEALGQEVDPALLDIYSSNHTTVTNVSGEELDDQ